MVNRYVEETLYLVCMQVHRYQPVYACHTQQVGHELRADAYARLALTVLTSPAEVRHNGTDAAGGGTFGSVNHQKEFHEVVRVREGALNEEHIAATDALFVAYLKLAIGEAGYGQIAEGATQFLTDFFGQIARSCARKYHEIVVVHCFGCVYVKILNVLKGEVSPLRVSAGGSGQ